MSTGQIWRRPDGLTWAEIQDPVMDPSGFRIMVPLYDPFDVPLLPPFVVALRDYKARVHLMVAVDEDDLGEPVDHLDPTATDRLQAAARTLLGGR